MPKGAQVIPLLHAVHMNPTLWKDAELFNPDRFINAEGKLVKPDYFMPFGVGRRMCLGVVLAQAELFLFISSLLHVFTLQVPEGEKLPSVLGQAGVTVQPGDFKVTNLTFMIPMRAVEPYFVLDRRNSTPLGFFFVCLSRCVRFLARSRCCRWRPNP